MYEYKLFLQKKLFSLFSVLRITSTAHANHQFGANQVQVLNVMLDYLERLLGFICMNENRMEGKFFIYYFHFSFYLDSFCFFSFQKWCQNQISNHRSPQTFRACCITFLTRAYLLTSATLASAPMQSSTIPSTSTLIWEIPVQICHWIDCQCSFLFISFHRIKFQFKIKGTSKPKRIANHFISQAIQVGSKFVHS